MIQIIIDSQSGELRVNSEALRILTDEESTYLRELAADLKRRYREDERLQAESYQDIAGD